MTRSDRTRLKPRALRRRELVAPVFRENTVLTHTYRLPWMSGAIGHDIREK